MEHFNKVLGDSVQRITETLGDRKNMGKLGQVAAASFATYYVVSNIYDAFSGPFASIPGPSKYKFFDVRTIENLESPPGTSWKKFQAFHEQYGEVVRLGPRHLLVSDKDMLKQLLQKDDIPKGKPYERIESLTGPNLFTSSDKVFHKQRRRVVSSAFSVKYLNSLEPYMANITESMLQRIERDIEKSRGPDGYGVVNVWTVIQHFALDIIGETAFGSTFHMLENQDHFVPHTIEKEMSIAQYLSTYSVAGPLKLLFNAKSLSQAHKELIKFMKKTIFDRLNASENARRNDILQILIDTVHSADADDRLTADAICVETLLFLIAGSDTTSNTIGFAFIRLMSNPDAYAKLREEIDAIEMEQGQTLLHHDQLKDLPYLNAVINETLRIDSISAHGMERCTDRDIVLGGRFFVPKGTIIHCNTYRAQLNPEYWPEPKKFIPERWLKGSKIPADTTAFFPFSAGSRNCIGQTFAQQEMRLSIANIIRQYDFKAIPEELTQAEDRRNFITLTVASGRFNVKATRRS